MEGAPGPTITVLSAFLFYEQTCRQKRGVHDAISVLSSLIERHQLLTASISTHSSIFSLSPSLLPPFSCLKTVTMKLLPFLHALPLVAALGSRQHKRDVALSSLEKVCL
jgi:hypothetical protein